MCDCWGADIDYIFLYAFVFIFNNWGRFTNFHEDFYM